MKKPATIGAAVKKIDQLYSETDSVDPVLIFQK
jgi:hypothetical protein